MHKHVQVHVHVHAHAHVHVHLHLHVHVHLHVCVITVSAHVQAMVERLLPGGFYHYLGSLTTPPCTPGVSWYVLKRKAVVCRRQIDRLTAVLTVLQRGVGVNNRATQPLHQRRVTMTPSSGVCVGGFCGPVPNVLLFLLLVACAAAQSRRTVLLGSALAVSPPPPCTGARVSPSPPLPWAAPELGSCASSGRALRH